MAWAFSVSEVVSTITRARPGSGDTCASSAPSAAPVGSSPTVTSSSVSDEPSQLKARTFEGSTLGWEYSPRSHHAVSFASAGICLPPGSSKEPTITLDSSTPS